MDDLNCDLHKLLAKIQAKARAFEPQMQAQQRYECPLCKDKEFVMQVDADGNIVAVPCKCRAKKAIRRMLRRTGMSYSNYAAMSLEKFPADTPETMKMKALAVDFIEHHKTGEGIIYTGTPGTMKTTICIAICLELAHRYNEPHTYFSYRTEIQRLKGLMYNQPDTYSAAIRKFADAENLYIDDLFKAATDDKNGVQRQDVQIMFEIVNARYLNKKTTLFSTEMPVREIIANVDEALGSRIYEMCRRYGMTCTGANRRLSKSYGYV